MAANVLILVAIVAGGLTLSMRGVRGQSPVQQTHVDGNIPAEGDFGRLLTRDLQQFFESTGPPVDRLEYELLRKAATQAGVGYPKYYVWVRLVRKPDVTVEGAARVAAQNKTTFRITDFLTREQIGADQSILDDVFPAEVAQKIRDRLRQ